MLTTTTTTTTSTTTTTPAPTLYDYQIRVTSTNVNLSSLRVSVSSNQTPVRSIIGVGSGSNWTFNWTESALVETGWSFRFSGIASADFAEWSKNLTGQQFLGGSCTISKLTLLKVSVIETDRPTLPINPLSLDNPEDTNSLDGVINDYLNE
jgi:hypothetical protein